MKNNDHQELLIHYWDYLIDYNIAKEDELLFLHAMHGLNLESLQSILHERTGYQTFNDHMKDHSKGQRE